MKILVTGSSGHLGEALVRTLRATDHTVVGLDITASPFTNVVGSVADRAVVERVMRGVDAVLHTATLHKPHVATHSAQAFVDTNVTGTLALLEAAVANRVRAFVFTSTTSAFGDALVPSPGEPAAWITESTRPIPKNIYGVTKTAAEDVCALFHRDHRLPCLILRTSRFFPEDDDHAETRQAYDAVNLKVNEYLYRRVDIEDAVSAHLLALERAPAIGFARYIISATTPFVPDDAAALRTDAPRVLADANTGLRSGVSAARLADVSRHRSRVRQRTRAHRTELAAALRLRIHPRAFCAPTRTRAARWLARWATRDITRNASLRAAPGIAPSGNRSARAPKAAGRGATRIPHG